MKLLNRRNHEQASVFLGVFVVLCVILFLAMLFTVGARANKIKPRSLPTEDTNAFFYIHISDVAQMPLAQPNPNPPGIVGKAFAAAPDFFKFTNQVWFYESNTPRDGALFIERTHDFISWTVLHWVMFDRLTFTNGVGYQTFVDLYAPIDRMSIYRAMIAPDAP